LVTAARSGITPPARSLPLHRMYAPAVSNALTRSGESCGTAALFDVDLTKVVVNVADLGVTGYDALSFVNESFGVQPELATADNVLLLVTLGNDAKPVRFARARCSEVGASYRDRDSWMRFASLAMRPAASSICAVGRAIERRIKLSSGRRAPRANIEHGMVATHSS